MAKATKWVLAGLLMTFSACMADKGPGIEIQNVIPPNDKCVWDPASTVFQSSGTWDVNSTSKFLLGLLVVNNYVSQPVSSGGTKVSSAGSFDFFPSGLKVEYSGQGPLASVKGTATIPTSGSIASDGGKQGLGVNVASADLAGQLKGLLPANGEGYLFVKMTLLGHLGGGTESESNQFTFPIVVTRRGVDPASCPAGQKFVPASAVVACGLGGQDGTYDQCMSLSAMDGGSAG